jgi:hypothetical protein
LRTIRHGGPAAIRTAPGTTSANQATIHVVATTFDGTRAALAAAVPLAKGSDARLVVLVPHIVPYAMDVHDAPDAGAFFARRYKTMVEALGGSAHIEVCVCRSIEDIVWLLTAADSQIVIGGPAGRWLTSPEERFANRLSTLGCRVIFVASGPDTTRRRIAPIAAALAAVMALAIPGRAVAQPARPSDDELRRRLAALEAEIAELKTLLQSAPLEVRQQREPQDEQIAADYLHDLKFGVALDTYYGYNFNRPIGRVNLLRAYDVRSNNFSLNQANAVMEAAPDLDAHRRFGGRLDLQYGQATETLQGSLANEPRPWVYRNVFQAYGTFVAPVGNGLTIDFGKWASSLGFEGNYTKDQINYSRSYWFNFLPFYHMGARLAYTFNDGTSVHYWVTNGTQQTEAFNNFKDQAVGITLQPGKTLTWNAQYYLGQEHPDVVLGDATMPTTLPTQPGLSITPVVPYFTGKLHIVDTYASWQASPALMLVGELDYVLNRSEPPAADAHVYGAAGYIRRDVTEHTALGVRAEYLRDDGGMFSGITQSLKETTVNYDYRPADGFLVRTEWRRDFSDKPFFPTETEDRRNTAQDTLTLGLVWWWGTKRKAW